MVESETEQKLAADIQDSDTEYEEENDSINMQSADLTDRQIEQVFDKGRFRLHQDRNDFTLPQILDFVKTKIWINIRPEYQRRLRWDRQKKSRLIESFLMNVPVPPIFLYEYDIARYEVMDGQQRLNTVIEFFSNDFPLSNLKVWSALNGKRLNQLPARVRRGLDRAKLSSIILVTDTGAENDPAIGNIRTQVFDRLNAGGVKLNAQELRNCLYSGSLNNLVVELGGNRCFTDVWGIPPHEENIGEDGSINDKLRQNPLYSQMKDCEIVLRFFAFRKEANVRGSVRAILDRYMENNRNLPEEIVDEYRTAFIKSLQCNIDIFGKDTFRLPPNDKGRRLLSRPLYDALMVAVDRLSDRTDVLLAAKDRIADAINVVLEDSNTYAVVVGRPNTADAIKSRIKLITEIVNSNID